MGVSKVYYTNMRTTLTENLLQKLERLVKKAGMMDIDFKNKYTAIKIHFGEPGNLAYLRTVIHCMWAGGKMPWIILMQLMKMVITHLQPDAM